jgi:hypothetical protein
LTRALKRERGASEGSSDAWKPKPGDVLVGCIQHYAVGHTLCGPVGMVRITNKETNQQASLCKSRENTMDTYRQLS